MKSTALTLVFLCTFLTCIFSQTSIQGTRTVDIGFHPALEQLKICAGVDFDNIGLFKPSAFIYSYDSSIAHIPSTKIKVYLVKSSEEIEKIKNVDFKVEASVPFSGSVSGEMTSNVKNTRSENNMMLVFMAETIYNPDSPNDNTITLSETAKSKLTNPEDFINSYGSYFCSSITKGHRILIQVSLRNSFSSTLENNFQNGSASADFDFIGVDAKASIRNELKSIASNNESFINIEALGGPELKEYRSVVSDLFRSDKSYEGILQFLSNLLSNFEYKNAKPLKCKLSDYSAWGINRNSLIRADIISTQLELKKIHSAINKELGACKLIINDQALNSNYSQEERETATENAKSLVSLRSTLYAIHSKLNKGDESQIGVEFQYNEEFNSIKRKNPEVFEYIPLRKAGTPMSFTHSTTSQQSNLNRIEDILFSSFIVNTIYSVSAYSYIDKISIINDFTGKKVETINTSVISADNTSSQYMTIGQIIETSRISQFCRNIDNDIVQTVDGLIKNGSLYKNKEVFQYLVVLTDKANRVYTFPLFEVGFSFQNQQGFSGTVTQLFPENCCTNMLDYNYSSNETVNLSYIENPDHIIINLKNLKFSDSLIIYIQTDNSMLNKRLTQNGELVRRYGEEDVKWISQNPFESIDLSLFYKNINELIFFWYSKDKNGQTGKVYTQRFPFSRKICNRIIVLKE